MKPTNAEVKMLRGIGLSDDEINTLPHVYEVPRDVIHPTICGSPPLTSVYDTFCDTEHSKRVTEYDGNPPTRHESGTGIHQLHTELLGLRSYALSMNEGILKGMKEYNEEMLENIIGVGNDIKYGEKLIQSELTDMRNDFRNQYISLRSTISSFLSFKNQHEFTRPLQPSMIMMREPNEYHHKVPSKQQHPHTEEYQQMRPEKNKQQNDGTVSFDKEAQIRSTVLVTPNKGFHSRPPKPQPEALSHHEMSMHVKRGTDARNDGPSTSNKKVKQTQLKPLTMMTPFRPVRHNETILSSHNLPRQGVRKIEVHLRDAYKSLPSEARELCTYPPTEVHDNMTKMSDQFNLNMEMEKITTQNMPKDNCDVEITELSDSTHCVGSENAYNKS